MPLIETFEVSGMALEISKASPIALFSFLLIKTTSSSPDVPHKNAIADPTFPAPIIEIILFC